MKKLLALVLAVAMTFAVVALVACGPTAQSETEKIIAEALKYDSTADRIRGSANRGKRSGIIMAAVRA